MAKKKGKGSKVFSIEEVLRSSSKEDLLELIDVIRDRQTDMDVDILKWMGSKQKATKRSVVSRDDGYLNGELIVSIWDQARRIVVDFNEYGGGPPSEEEEAYDHFEDMMELAKKKGIPSEYRREVLDSAYEQYILGNSGFDDALDDLMCALCKDEEDWRYLASLYMKSRSDWDKKRAMRIFSEHVGDDDSYMELRMSIMDYGMDYWDLVQHYRKRNMNDKALETAEEGILKGEGRCTELFSYLFDHYDRISGTADIERIMRIATDRKNKEYELSMKAFEHHRKKGDYDKAKGYLIDAFERIRWGGYMKHFEIMRGYIKEKEWEKLERGYLDVIIKKNPKDYLGILMILGRKDDVLSYLLGQHKLEREVWMTDDDMFMDEYASKIADEYPDRIAEYFVKRALKYIALGKRENYRYARICLERARDLYVNVLKDKRKWGSILSGLKEDHRRRRLFMEEIKGLK